MIRVYREIIYSNGKITVANTFDKIEVLVYRDEQIVESKLYSMEMWDKKVVLDNVISTLKGRNTLLYIEDDCTRVLSHAKRRYIIRGTGSWIHVVYFNDHSSFMKQVFLNYNYSEISMADYANIFAY